MSNITRNLKRTKSNTNLNSTKAVLKTVKNVNNKINFAERIVPNALYIKLSTSEIKITEINKTIADTPVAMILNQDNSNFSELLDILQRHEETLSKVIIDNDADFKIIPYDEFKSKAIAEHERLAKLSSVQ